MSYAAPGKLKTAFVREGDRYTLARLRFILDCPKEEDPDNLEIDKKIRRLKKLKAIKVINPKDDIEDPDNLDQEYGVDYGTAAGCGKYWYTFTYVGVIVMDGRVVLWCYPKYLLQGRDKWNADPDLSSGDMVKVKDSLRLVLDVLRKYSRTDKKIGHQSPEDISKTVLGREETESPNLGVMLYLLDDYYENDLYINTEEIREWNGPGEIIWDRTINDSYAMISCGKPYYMELQTRRQVTDDMDFFLRLHQCVMTAISREMGTELLSLFGYPPIELSEQDISDFGDEHYIQYRLERELNVQFNTRKQNVLKAMSLYIRGRHLQDNDHITTFGTNVFYKVWEDICGTILNNQLNFSLSALGLKVPPAASYHNFNKLIEAIEHPSWIGLAADATLIPDIITTAKSKGVFYIFDTKYYIPTLEGPQAPQDQPGIESVTKQYLYQLAYRPLTDYNGFTVIKNSFIFPTEEDKIRNAGDVELKMLHSLNLENIQIIYLPAKVAYVHYLTGRPLDISELKLR
ncbi:MAG: LlaJI family restriction endonuclease [Clostridia bacterium]|nr:LlaJI family restriction endonuclease [Clostridia bacterium]